MIDKALFLVYNIIVVMSEDITGYMQTYRSGHNGADSKSVCAKAHMGSNPILSATKSTVIYYGGLFLCHKMLNNKNFRLFRYIVSPEAKASRSDTGSFQAWCRSIFRALLSVSPIDIQSVPPCCGIAGVEVLCSADCCRPVCPAGPFRRSVVLR